MTDSSPTASPEPKDLYENIQAAITDENDLIATLQIDELEIPCTISIKNSEIKVQTSAPEMNFPEFFNINLAGIMESKVIPHPSMLIRETLDEIEAPEAAATLILTFLSNVFDKASTQTVFFTSFRAHLINLQKQIEDISAKTKKGIKFEAPRFNPNRRKSKMQGFNPSLFAPSGPSSSILGSSEIECLRLSFPRRYQMFSWKMLYRASINGFSLSTVYDLSSRAKPLVLVISDDSRTKFGAYLPEGIRNERGFYGTGETFVFTFNPHISVYRWSEQNKYFVCSNNSDLIIGSSKNNSGSAIYLNDRLLDGASNSCQTFGSPSLAGKPFFRVVNIEIWQVMCEN